MKRFLILLLLIACQAEIDEVFTVRRPWTVARQSLSC